MEYVMSLVNWPFKRTLGAGKGFPRSHLTTSLPPPSYRKLLKAPGHLALAPRPLGPRRDHPTPHQPLGLGGQNVVPFRRKIGIALGTLWVSNPQPPVPKSVL